ncbi:MAG TPA: hypothetical protein VK869_14325 [Rubrobacteraceae bacterium]|nr:hypothetical protein [Rubrobacteraceae bacterium]
MQHAISFRRLVAVLVSGVLLLGLLTAGAEFALAQGASQNGQDRQDDRSSDTSSRDDAADDVSAAESQYDGQSAADDQYDDQQADEECVNPREVETFTSTEDREVQPTPPFEITGEVFRLRFETEPDVQDTSRTTVRVIVDVWDENEQPIGEGFVARGGADGSENILAGPGTFRLNIRADAASYEITVEDCVEAANNNDDRPDDVINVPNKKRLAKTGGMPLPGVALLAFALVGSGLSVFRHAVRRDDS